MANHVGVFLPLPKSIAKGYPYKEQDESPAHVTVLYLGDQPASAAQKIAKAVKDTVERMKPFSVRGRGIDYFNNDETVAYTPVNSSRLHELRDKLKDALRDAGVEWEDTHPTYTPHVTIQYLDKGEEWDGEQPAWSFTADRVEVWGFEHERSFKLGKQESLAANPFRLVCERMVSHIC